RCTEPRSTLRPLPSFPTRRSSDLGWYARVIDHLTRAFHYTDSQQENRLTPGHKSILYGAPANHVYQKENGPKASRFLPEQETAIDRKSTRLNSSHEWISYAVFCLK